MGGDEFGVVDDLRAMLRVNPEQRRAYEAEGLWADDTLTRWLEDAATGDRLAAIAGDRELTYSELLDRSERLAGGLRDLGVRAGDVVSVQLGNSIEFLVAYFGAARVGAVISTVHLPYRIAEIRTLLAHAECVAFIAQSDQKEFCPIAAAIGLKVDLPHLRHVISVGKPVDGAIDFSTLLSRPRLDASVDSPAADDPFLLLFTSGTSAGPKAVPLSYERVLGNARVGVREHRLQPTDTILSVAGYTHLLGLYSLHLATRAGAANVLFPAYSPADLSDAISRRRPSVLVCAPAHLAGLIVNGLLDKTDFSSVRLVITAGSALPPDVAKAVSAVLANGFLTNLWGMTELQGTMTGHPNDGQEPVIGSVGWRFSIRPR